MQAAINAAFARFWIIGTVETPCRYRLKGGKHILKTFSGLLDKGTKCIHPDGEVFEVVDSYPKNATTHEHILKPYSDEPAPDWTPPR